jgi:hypothetical protein
MPWAKVAYERTNKVYKDLLSEPITELRKDLDLTVKELLVRTEILKHDFTKRQLSILMLIITLSYIYGKEYAVIPKLQDFELTGISKKHIKSELTKLIEMNVIEWIKENNLFRIQEPRFWVNAPYNSGYNDRRGRDLFLLNLRHAGIDTTKIEEKLNKLGL